MVHCRFSHQIFHNRLWKTSSCCSKTSTMDYCLQARKSKLIQTTAVKVHVLLLNCHYVRDLQGLSSNTLRCHHPTQHMDIYCVKMYLNGLSNDLYPELTHHIDIHFLILHLFKRLSFLHVLRTFYFLLTILS